MGSIESKFHGVIGGVEVDVFFLVDGNLFGFRCGYFCSGVFFEDLFLVGEDG